MIHSRDIDPNADIKASQLRGHGFEIAVRTLFHNVNPIRYVDSNGAGAANLPSAGFDPDKGAFLTAAYAVTQVPADTLVVVRENHTETIAVSDAFAWAQAGVKVIGLGSGTERPTFTFTTAAADIALDKANLGLVNLRFINGIDAQVVMVLMNAASGLVQGCYFQQGDATTQAKIAIAAGLAMSGSKILDNEIITTTDTGGESGINISIASNNVEIARNWIYGDFSDAGIVNKTNALTLLHIHHNTITNLQSGDHAIELQAACTGVIAYNIANSTLAAAGGLTAIDQGSCFACENYGVDATADVSGLLNPVADS